MTEHRIRAIVAEASTVQIAFDFEEALSRTVDWNREHATSTHADN
jgi:hypothetical protein